MLFTFPSRYSFAIGHRIVFRLGRWSCQLQPGFLVSRLTQGSTPNAATDLRLQGFHLLWRRFPARFGSITHVRRRSLQDPPAPPSNPDGTTAAAFCAPSVWATPRSLAATGGITLVSFSSGYLDVSVPLVRLVWAMYSPHDDRASPRPGFPIRIPMDQRSLAAPHGFSQLATSFFAVLCPGIHLAPFFA